MYWLIIPEIPFALCLKALIGFQGRGRDEVVSPDLCHDLFL
jgi:hypothetical protein